MTLSAIVARMRERVTSLLVGGMLASDDAVGDVGSYERE